MKFLFRFLKAERFSLLLTLGNLFGDVLITAQVFQTGDSAICFSPGFRTFQTPDCLLIILFKLLKTKILNFLSRFGGFCGGVFIIAQVFQTPGGKFRFLSGFYAVIIEFLLLPLKLNAERKMNEEMDLGE